MNFKLLKIAISKQFEKMQKGRLFRVNVSGEEMWETYLKSFPPGTNPIYRERTEHDCSCCRNFIRDVGNIVNEDMETIWDVICEEYQPVVDAMAALVKSREIVNVFLHYEKTAGTDKNFEQIVNGVLTWEHFFVNIDKKHVEHSKNIDTKLSEHRANCQVFRRGLEEIKDDAIDTVLDLIASGSLYRGDEHKPMVLEFQKLKAGYKGNPWVVDSFATRIRNTVIGTLLTDLSEGVDLEKAVKSFETKVAPMNYKRPTALVTKAMVDKAKAKIKELGLTSALERRYATVDDIDVKDVLFVDRSTGIGGDLFDNIESGPSLKRVEEVGVDKFLADILPRTHSLEVLFENKHVPNLVTLIGPADATAGKLFKWNNNFSWSYNGEVTDSIKEKVKAAGGSVTGELCCRLAWYNYDDLDLHMVEPNGREVFYANKKGVMGGVLDVDMNAGSGKTREPVENIFYTRIPEGRFKLKVHQFSRRESKDVGFEVEMDMLGDVRKFSYPQVVAGVVDVCDFEYSRSGGFKIIKSLDSTEVSRKVWGIETGKFHPVNILTLSPNYWGDNAVGNKHYMFMINGCEGEGRGIYNEFLRSDLDQHRKVFEIVGSRLSVGKSMAGLGFSSTKRDSLVCRVNGRVFKVVF